MRQTRGKSAKCIQMIVNEYNWLQPVGKWLSRVNAAGRMLRGTAIEASKRELVGLVKSCIARRAVTRQLDLVKKPLNFSKESWPKILIEVCIYIYMCIV